MRADPGGLPRPLALIAEERTEDGRDHQPQPHLRVDVEGEAGGAHHRLTPRAPGVGAPEQMPG